MNNILDTLIVGAGIAGMLIAERLQESGQAIRVLEKSKGVGGRMATRRHESWVWDHGAQYFTLREPQSNALNAAWQAQGWSTCWAEGFVNIAGQWSEPLARWRGTSSMTQIAKGLAEKLPIERGCRVLRITPQKDAWVIQTDTLGSVKAARVVLTAPVPQSLQLIEDLPVEPKLMDDLKAIQYAPCLALLLGLSQPSFIPPPGGLIMEGDPVLHWVADNQQKGISNAPSITVHANGVWSQAHFDALESEIVAALSQAVAPWVSADTILSHQLMRWRYSLALSTYHKPYVCLDDHESLYMAGDGFGGPRVEGAILSALALSDTFLMSK